MRKDKGTDGRQVAALQSEILIIARIENQSDWPRSGKTLLGIVYQLSRKAGQDVFQSPETVVKFGA